MVVEAEAATQVGVEGLVFESLTNVLKSDFFPFSECSVFVLRGSHR